MAVGASGGVSNDVNCLLRPLSEPLSDNQAMHLLIPYASTRSEDCQLALASLKLPQLEKLLHQLTLTATDYADDGSLIPVHERALAAAHGIFKADVTLDGQLPWGAWYAAQGGRAMADAGHWAVITPCHWAVQTKHITMISPRALQLAEEESRQLMAVMQPFFVEDGITLQFDTATRWLAQGAVFAGLATASPYRVFGGRVDDWLPKEAAAKGLRRLQQEMQMLLYTHPLTDARASQGLPAVNSFWVSGTGDLPADFDLTSVARSPSPLICPNSLRDAALAENWPAWVNAWQHIDATECVAALDALRRGESVTLTLCGDNKARRFDSVAPRGWAKVKRLFKRQVSPQTLLSALDHPNTSDAPGRLHALGKP